MPAKSPVDISDPLLSVSVLVNGTAVSDAYPLLSVNIVHEVNRISYAELVYGDGKLDDGTFPISDSADFVPGNTIEIKASFTNVPGSIFKGYIVKQGIRINSSSLNTVVVTCKHKAVALTYNKTEAEFSAKADS